MQCVLLLLDQTKLLVTTLAFQPEQTVLPLDLLAKSLASFFLLLAAGGGDNALILQVSFFII